MFEAVKVALDPSPVQESLLLSHAGGARFAYNVGLAHVKEAIDAGEKPGRSFYTLRKWWNANKDELAVGGDGETWWQENSKESYSYGLESLAKGLSNWSKSRKGDRKGRKVGFPKFKSKDSDTPRFAYTAGCFGLVKGEPKALKLPRIGRVHCMEDVAKRVGDAKVLRMTISQYAGRWYASLTVERDDKPVASPPKGGAVGVDLGQHSLYVDSRGGETTSSKIREAKRKYAHNRKTLQEKGTRSAHRRLKAMSGREKRFIRDVNHCVSKQLANSPNVQAIAFEDLTHIRRQAAKRSKTSKRRRNMLHQWSFSQLQEFTTYKAAANGIRIIMVDPSYTSQQCNRCGYVDAGNRNRARFDCKRCAWSDNADHNAAMNIRDRAIATLEHENTSTDRPVDRVQSTTRMDGTPTMTSTSDDDGRVVGDHVHVQTAGLAPEVVDVA